jgi:hypothetical protein
LKLLLAISVTILGKPTWEQKQHGDKHCWVVHRDTSYMHLDATMTQVSPTLGLFGYMSPKFPLKENGIPNNRKNYN